MVRDVADMMDRDSVVNRDIMRNSKGTCGQGEIRIWVYVREDVDINPDQDLGLCVEEILQDVGKRYWVI